MTTKIFKAGVFLFPSVSVSGLLVKKLVLLLGLALSSSALAQEYRQIRPIERPRSIPSDTRAVTEELPVSRELINSSIRTLLANWNSQELAEFLGEDFYGKDRLTDNIVEKVQRDARIRVLAIQGSQTLQQYIRRKAGGGEELVSVVSVTADTQVEFSDPDEGYRRLPGSNEYVLRIIQPFN